MPGKTKKSVTKRFKITKNKRLSHRFPHQNHLNAGQTGNEKRRKRGRKNICGSLKKQLISLSKTS